MIEFGRILSEATDGQIASAAAATTTITYFIWLRAERRRLWRAINQDPPRRAKRLRSRR